MTAVKILTWGVSSENVSPFLFHSFLVPYILALPSPTPQRGSSNSPDRGSQAKQGEVSRVKLQGHYLLSGHCSH